MFHGHLDYFQKPPLGGRPNTKPGDHGPPNTHNHWFILFYCVWRHAWVDIHWNSIWLRAWSCMTSHYTWGSVPHYMILEVSWDGLWTLSFGLSQFHGHGSWLVCEVALSQQRYALSVIRRNMDTFIPLAWCPYVPMTPVIYLLIFTMNNLVCRGR
jgi:hypothetical protein